MAFVLPFLPEIGAALAEGGAMLWAAATSSTGVAVIGGAATAGTIITANEIAKSRAKEKLKDIPIAQTCTTGTCPCARMVIISRAASPQAARHIDEAQASGYPKTLTLDRPGTIARRRAATSVLAPGGPGIERDEYPPATFLEGGAGASVRYMDWLDNRSAGGQLQAQMNRPAPATEGCRVTITTGP